MKKSVMFVAMAITAMSVQGQETYESAQIATQDLNGTARYIGMGGAMEALGADISTISSNPAGIGMFRRPWAGVSGGLTVQNDGSDASKTGKTNADLNQAGFVYSIQANNDSWFNLAFNYSKNRNFNEIMNAGATLKGSSSSKHSYIEYDYWGDNASDGVSRQAVFNDYTVGDALGGYSAANAYGAYHDNHGYIGNFDFNFSGNIHNRFFLGLTVGIKNVSYHNDNAYAETLVDLNDEDRGTYTNVDERKVTGAGFNLKFGMIFRPVETSPFRIGLYVHTPTWYDLTAEIYRSTAVDITDVSNGSLRETGSVEYDYRITTPWLFGASIGHTIGSMIALGATYEYADYTHIKSKMEYDDYYSDYSEDVYMNHNTKTSLQGVHTLKLGMEVKPVPEVALRVGYNYVSPMYETDGHKDYTIDSYYSDGKNFATYDYTNWKATNRVTFGLGFSVGRRTTLDLSYQYSTRKGEYHPFENASYTYTDDGQTINDANIGTVSKVKDNRHQVNCTLGYRF